MKIGIVGGTGREGRGLAVRWAQAGHDVFIGSRDAARGASKASEFSSEFGTTLQGGDNTAACRHGELIVVTVPYTAHRPTFESIASSVADKVIVDITVPLQPPKVRSVNLPEGQSAALEAHALLGEEARLVAALHHISSDHLSDPDHTFDCDVLVCGNDKDARAAVISVIGDLGLRGVDAGVLRNAIALESLTPVLLHINRRYKSVGSGIRITGIPEGE
ncbi:MAG: NADPH-dependent F420 reductase [Polyangiales bacterium]